MFGVFVGYSILIPTVNTIAAEDTANTKVSASVTPTISLSAEGADETGALPIEIDFVSGNNMGTGQMLIKVSTNDPEGYSLFINTDKPDTTLSQNGITDRVKALPGETAVADFPENYWGYSIDGGSTYYPVQPSTNNPALYPETAETAPRAKVYNAIANEDETNVTIGAKVKASLPSGTYSNTVVFTAMPNMNLSSTNP
ncbi:MAG: hypothetical protein Q4A25_02080 [Candidatus Saccharibacteria bacterium]|nr:hypothetical protein [Candidatus Saccharibacteria bacterium]